MGWTTDTTRCDLERHFLRLQGCGFSVLRFADEEVGESQESVIDAIVTTLRRLRSQ
jgi:very-short-patch-repair endonuclease